MLPDRFRCEFFRCGIITIVMWFLVVGVHAQQPATVPSYLIWPVKTELQRELTGKTVDLLVLMDTTEALRGDKVFLDALNLKELRKQLSAHKKADSHLRFRLFFPRREPLVHQSENLLRLSVLGWAHEILPFSKISAYGDHMNDKTTWQDLVRSFSTKQAPQANVDETAKGDELVKCYRVQSEFSRFLASGTDCVLIINASLGMDKGAIPERIRKAATKHIAELGPFDKKKVCIVVHPPFLPPEQSNQLREELFRFATQLGFESGVIRGNL